MATRLDRVDPEWAWSAYEPDEKMPWNRRRAAHLFRRAGFAANARQLDEAARNKPSDVVAGLFSSPAETQGFEDEMSQLADTLLAGGNSKSLSAWWLYRMLLTPRPLLEKATLFWHGHFATSAAKVTESAAMLAQNELLRRYALGRFSPLVQAISKDPAMLVYLDSTTNRKTHPNENYARELMELFCLGPGNYTERDIQEIARCFTGWEIERGKFYFNAYQHDDGSKTFLGKTGKYGGCDAVRIVLEQPAAARFLAGKLFRFFVCDEPVAPETLIEPLAKEIRESEFDMGRAIRRILASRIFFSVHALARKIRSPVELGVGLLRSLEATTNVVLLARDLDRLGQAPFFPPNVKGWDGGRTWINTSTLLGRANFVRRLLSDDNTRFGRQKSLDTYLANCGIDKPEEMVDWLLDLLLAVPLTKPLRTPLVDLASRPGPRDKTIANVIHAICTLPEFQLA